MAVRNSQDLASCTCAIARRAIEGDCARRTVARYEHLSIYKQALDVAVHFENVVAGFSRYHKYTLGTELRNQIWIPLIVLVDGLPEVARIYRTSSGLRSLRLWMTARSTTSSPGLIS